MSTSNQISVSISDAVIAQASTHLQEAKNLLAPYLQGLTDKERIGIVKMGDKTVATVSKIKSYLQTNGEFTPSYFNTEEFLKDEQLVQQLYPLSTLAEQLSSDLGDTLMLAGSEALQAALIYYGAVNNAAKQGVAAAKPIYEDLSQRFLSRSRRKPVE
jgi:hypothetical protein